MAGKDVDLIIRAQDRASKEVKRISDSLKDFKGETVDLAKGVDKAGAAFEGLANDVNKFQRETDRLKSLSKIAAELDKTSAAVTRMESSVRDSAGEFGKLARESDAAAQASSRLKAQLDSEEKALLANKAALAAARKEQTEANKLVKQAETAQNRYNKSLAGTPDTAQPRAQRSAGAFIADDLDAAKAKQAAVNAQVQLYERAVEGASSAIKDLKPQVASATSLQRTLANETERAAAALKTERNDLGTARTALGDISDVAGEAGKSLGIVTISQDQVSAAASRMAANLAAAKARIEGLSSTKTTPQAVASTNFGAIDENTLANQRRSMLEARKEWVASQAAVKALAAEMKAADVPTEELGAAFGRAQAQARLNKTAYDEQTVALQRLSGAATSSFREFSQSAAGMRSAGASAANANNQIASSANAAANGQRSLAPQIRASGAGMGDAAAKTNAFGASLKGLQNDTRQTLSLTQRLRGEILSLTASYIGFQAVIGQVGGAINAYQTLEAVQSRLGAVFDQDTAKVSAEIQFLQQNADRLGISFSVLADEYGKFTVAANAANFSLADTRKIFLSVAEAARVNRLSTEQTSGVFLALTQMISKGKVSAQELRQQLGDRLTGAFNIFAQAIGVTTAQLDKMMQQGEVLADRSTMLKFADEMTARFGPQLGAALDSASADIGRFDNDINQMQLTIAQGLIPGLRAALQSFDEFSKSTEGREVFTQIGVSIGKFLTILAEVPKYFDAITFAAKVFAAVKIAEVFTGLAGKMVTATATASAFSREIALVGPRTQQAAAAQGVLARGLSQVVSTLGVYRTNLLASTSATAAARIGVVGLAGAVGVLRTGLLAAGTLARGFLAAFGGPIGLAITAITFAVGAWVTNVDSATSALTEHERQLGIVVAGYDAAGDKAGDWAKQLAGVTLAQAVANTEQLRATFQGMIDDLDKLSRVLKYAFMDFAPDSAQVLQLKKMTDAIAGVKAGTTDLKGLSDVLNEIALNPADQQLKEIALQMLDMVNVSKDGETSITDLSKAVELSEAKLRVMNGTATDADKVLLGLKDAVDATTDAFDKASLVKTYTDAIDTLTSKVPGLAEEMKKLKDITELNKTAWNGMVAAFKAGDFSAIARIIGLWSQAGAATAAASDQKRFDQLPDTSKSVIDRIIFVEGGQTGGGPSTSTARGIGQFTEQTWLPLFDKLFPALSQLTDAAKLQYRSNEAFARPMLEALTKQNQMALANAGVAPTDANTYLAHFLGAGDAIKVALANPEALASTVVKAASVAANPTVFKPGLTVADLQQWANQKMGGGSPINSGGQTDQEKTNEDVQARIELLKQEAEGRAESNREGAIAKELAEAQNAATKAGTTLTQDQITALRDAAGAKYDSAHADEQLKANQEAARDLLSQIVGLDQQRKTLLEEINTSQEAGDNSKTAELQTQLTGINTQLDGLIPKAQEFARSLGDEKMVATLQKVQFSTAKAGQQFSLFGLSLNQTKGLITGMADGIVGIFDSFAQAIANGQDAVKALGVAFLQFAADFLRQIATMILKQMVLNALQSFFPGLGSFGAGHTGGMVGSSAIGGGNSSRQISPAWFTNAMRYHTGGIAGLRPDEVPAVLKKNEEVITEEDPRHRFNSTKGGSDNSQASSIKQVLVLDPADLATAMASKAGEKVMITFLKNNRTTVRSMLG